MSDIETPRRIYIREAAKILNRRMNTVRKWDQMGVLPEHLRPHRGNGNANWRYWTPEQIEGIKDWIRETNYRHGRGLPHYQPTEKKLDEVIVKMRRPHKPVRRTQSEENK